MNVPSRKGLFTRRKALGIVAGAGATVVTLGRLAWFFARIRASDVSSAGNTPSPLTDQRPPFVLSF